MAKKKRRVSRKGNAAQVDIVVPVYGEPGGKNGGVEKCITAIRNACQNIPYTLTLVDDCSPSIKHMNNVYDKLGIHKTDNEKIIYNSVNMGFPETVNVGVSRSGRAPIVVLVNTDVIVDDQAIDTMCKTFDYSNIPHSPVEPTLNAPIGIVGAKLIFPEDTDRKDRDGRSLAGRVQHAGMAVSYRRLPEHIYSGWPNDHIQVNVLKRVQIVTGAFMGIKRELWNKVHEIYKRDGDPSNGAFNTVYGRGTFEDMELCIAARTLGYSVVYNSEIVATHEVGQSVGNNPDENMRGYNLNRNLSIWQARWEKAIIWDMPIQLEYVG